MKNILFLLLALVFTFGCSKKSETVDTVATISPSELIPKIEGYYHGTLTSYAGETFEMNVRVEKNTNISVDVILVDFAYTRIAGVLVTDGGNEKIVLSLAESHSLNGTVIGKTLDFTSDGDHFVGTRP